MALNNSPALATDHFVPCATCCPLSAVADSATAFDMATEATAIKHYILPTVSSYHSDRTISHSKRSTARKSPLHFVRGCPAFARLIQLMNLFATFGNYIEQPVPDNRHRRIIWTRIWIYPNLVLTLFSWFLLHLLITREWMTY